MLLCRAPSRLHVLPCLAFDSKFPNKFSGVNDRRIPASLSSVVGVPSRHTVTFDCQPCRSHDGGSQRRIDRELELYDLKQRRLIDTGLVDSTGEARIFESVRPHHRSEGRVSSDCPAKHVERPTGNANRHGVSAKLAGIPADRARHARSVFTFKVTTVVARLELPLHLSLDAETLILVEQDVFSVTLCEFQTQSQRLSDIPDQVGEDRAVE